MTGKVPVVSGEGGARLGELPASRPWGRSGAGSGGGRPAGAWQGACRPRHPGFLPPLRSAAARPWGSRWGLAGRVQPDGSWMGLPTSCSAIFGLLAAASPQASPREAACFHTVPTRLAGQGPRRQVLHLLDIWEARSRLPRLFGERTRSEPPVPACFMPSMNPM